MNSERKPWTPEADERLRLAVIGGKSLAEISGTLGRSVPAVKARAYNRFAGDRDEPSRSGEVGLRLNLVSGSD